MSIKKTLRELLEDAVQAQGLTISASKLDQYAAYLRLMQKWQKTMNLTSILKDEDMVDLHIVDSLTVQPFLQGERLLDVGSGAGLPGIPLAIADTTRQWTLLEKNKKKCRFLVQVIAELGLTNVAIQNLRVQDFHPGQCFDTILARAFTNVRDFLLWTEHLICPNGRFIMMKGHYPQEEIAAIPTDFLLTQCIPTKIVGREVERHLLCLTKKH